MVEAELLIGHLRHQVRHLEALVSYLESQPAINHDDFSYSHGRLRELIGRLRALERFSSERGAAARLRTTWLN